MMKLFVVLSWLFFFVACTKETYDVVNLNDNAISKLGHGGMGIGNLYPMNSMESLTKCLNLGVDGVEFDVQLTKDNVLIAFHDRDMSGISSNSGLVRSKTWDEIKGSTYTNIPFTSYDVVSVDEIFSAFSGNKKYLYTFDCKLYYENEIFEHYCDDFIHAIIDIVEKHNLENNVLIESNNTYFLKTMQELKPDFKLFIYPQTFEDGLQIAKDLNLYGITISNDKISAQQVALAHAHNIRITLWNVKNKKQNIDAIKKNPDYIQTDDVRSLLKLLKN